MRSLNILLPVGFLLVGATCSAQFFNASHVPTESKIILADLHPHLGSKVTWTQEPEGYQAAFVLHNKPHYVLFDFQGDYRAEASTISKRSLPKRIRKHLHETYRAFRIQQTIVIKSSSGAMLYEARVTHGVEDYKLIFNDSGYILEVLPLPVSITEE
jgi:hypothetical protein